MLGFFLIILLVLICLLIYFNNTLEHFSNRTKTCSDEIKIKDSENIANRDVEIVLENPQKKKMC